ncbi:hypothetical protein [Burkholderia gladioli]|uniref:hypothetical protein n=1 Tax=Burkholderia gladioli TaxID=28095 RepID=UPI0016409D6D|nr:hypothetical protein [Burkholderia gladioli]
MRPLSHTERAVEFWSDRQLQQYNDAEAADAAAEERGAERAVAELIRCAARAGVVFAKGPSIDGRLFIASFCGAIQCDFPDLARAIAAAAGMPHLYAEGN